MPVDIIQRRARHALAGGGVDKLVIRVVNTDVQTALSGTGLEEDQIAGQQFALIDFRADLRLLTRFARSCNANLSRKVISTNPEQSTPRGDMPP